MGLHGTDGSSSSFKWSFLDAGRDVGADKTKELGKMEA
jgi:hypothetical protein